MSRWYSLVVMTRLVVGDADPAQAQTRFGSGNTSGVIQIIAASPESR